MTEIPLRAVSKAYEQVSEQLRELILSGELKPGTRLPTEPELASRFHVSRTTVREALRMLSAEGLVRTGKGSNGGAHVTHPSIDDVQKFLRTNIGLLSSSNVVSLDELLEAREVLEVPAARIAAERHAAEDMVRLRAAVPDVESEPASLSTESQFVSNREFHSTIVDMCSNQLLTLAARPVFIALQTHLVRAALDIDFHQTINQHHREIAEAIDHRDSEAASNLMADHLRFLRPIYGRVWTAETE